MLVGFALSYFVVVWIVIRLLVPHLGFNKSPLPEFLPQDFSAVIKQIDEESSDNFDFLQKVYEFVTSRYKGDRFKTVTNFWVAFEEPINHKRGFMPCTGQNYLTRLMLVKSGRFKDADIEIKVFPLNFFIHQYLRVRVDGRWVDVDPWSSFLGLSLGQKISLIG